MQLVEMKRKAASGAQHARSTKRHKDRDCSHMNESEKLYSVEDSILVLGDGDFTFARGILAHRGGGRNLCATSYDSELQVKAKYSNAADCIKSVKGSGAVVLHDVDATKLLELPRRARVSGVGSKVPSFFQYIIFNFPHTGQQRVHLNRALLLEFFESARRKLVKAGEVHITLKNRPPYSNWLVEDQAKAAGFVLKARRKFNHRLFPGYNHRTTDPDAKKFEAELCITYVFIVNRTKYPFDPTDVDDGAVDEVINTDAHEADSNVDEEAPLDSTPMPIPKTVPTKLSWRQRRKQRLALLSTAQPAKTADIKPVKETREPAKSMSWLWRPLHRRAGAR